MKNGAEHKVPVVLQLPNMKTKYGYSHSEKYNSHNIDVDFDKSTRGLLQCMEELDSANKKACYKQRHIWFKNSNDITEDVLDFLFQGLVKCDGGSKRSHSSMVDNANANDLLARKFLRLKINTYTREGTERMSLHCYGLNSTSESQTLISASDITEGAGISTIVHFNKIFMGEKVYSCMNVKQIQLENTGNLRGYGFVKN